MLRIGGRGEEYIRNEVSGGTNCELGLVKGPVIQLLWEDKAGSGSGLHYNYSRKLKLGQSQDRRLLEKKHSGHIRRTEQDL